MARRRWVQINGELIEVTDDYVAPQRGGGASGDSALWNDRAYQDGNDPRFTSRSQHRDYMRRHGLATVDDYAGQWRKDERRRLDYRHRGTDPTRKGDLLNALRKLEK